MCGLKPSFSSQDSLGFLQLPIPHFMGLFFLSLK